jgi:predicted AAA+ superfamily ATPase
MIIRKQLITLQERMCEPRQFIQLLAGTRQVGKTTLVKQFVLTYTRKITSKSVFSCTSRKKSVSLRPNIQKN